MTNVLIITSGKMPVMKETLRVYGMLQDKGFLKMRSVKSTKICRKDIEWCDTVLFVRSASLIEYELLKIFKKFNKYCIYTIDDDMLSLDDKYGKDGEGYWGGFKNYIIRMLQNVDCFLGVNEPLAKKYVKIGNISKYALTETIIEHKEIFQSRQEGINKEFIRIALYVNDGTSNMFERFIRPVLPLLCEKYPHRIQLYLMTLKPIINEVEGMMDVIYVPHMSYQDFKNFMGTESLDIGLAPLVDEGFAVYKYFNKYVEYTVAGIPAIYSDCKLYKTVIHDGYNGILCKNTKDDWYNAICDLIDNPQKRLEIIKHAQEHIINHFNKDSVLNKLLNDVPQLSSYKAPYISVRKTIWWRLRVIKIKNILFRIGGWHYTAKQYIKQGKIKPMVERFYIHFLHNDSSVG